MRTIVRSIFVCALAFMALASNALHAEDIDLYYGGTTGGDANILFVLDNESNWSATMGGTLPSNLSTVANCNDSSYYCAQKYALISLLQKTKADGSYFLADTIGVGIMMYGSGNNKGSYVRFGIRKMTAANRAALIQVLRNLDVLIDKGSSQQDFGLVMWEAFKYFGGGTGSSSLWSYTKWGPIPDNGVGEGTDSRDFANNSNVRSAFTAGAGSPYAYTSASTNNTTPPASPPVKYNSPVHSDPCGKNYIIYIGHSNSQDNDSLGGQLDQNAQAMFIGVNGSTTRVNPGSASSGDEAARYLFNSDVDPTTTGTQNVVTYTIGTYDAPCSGQVCSMITTMKSMAAQGGGSYYDATDIGKLADAFDDILSKIQGINSVFVSATLPVSVNTQGTYQNQVFIGMFRPDAGGSPDWVGNLKQYKLKYDAATNTLRLADSLNNEAIDGGTGLLAVTAASYWTTNSTFWTNWVGTSRTESTSASDSPDGPFVEKGGAAQRLREDNLTTQVNRKVYTCPIDSSGNAACVSSTALTGTTYKFAMNSAGTAPEFGSVAATNLAFGLPATTTAAELAAYINWARGTDNLGNEGGPGVPTTVRPTIHGDVLHSRPVALNYAGRVVTFYGSNEGMVRAVEGKQTGTGAGSELWAFMAPEVMKIQNRLRTQSPQVVLPSNTTDTSTNKSYALDGPIGAYQEGSTAIIYVAARRGGNFIYAFDVSNPDAPAFKFKLSPSTANMSNLGQTWSAPRVMKIRGPTTAGRVVLIFGGGYDISEDTNSHGTVGRGVYVVDALTGTVIKQFLTTPAAEGSLSISTSVPSEVAIVDSDRDGFIDRGYVGDMAGNIWRIDLDDGTSSNSANNWSLHKLASLGTNSKFFYPPDVVLTTGFAAVLIGSGDREKPLVTTTSDRVYMIKDAATGLDGSGQTTVVQADLVSNTTATSAELNASKGWYYDLRTGEKVVNGPLTVGGVVYLGTNRPTPGAVCTGNLGEARSYALDFFTGAGARPPSGSNPDDDAFSQVLSPLTGLPPSPVAGLIDIGNGTVVPFCIGCGERRSALEAGIPDIDPTPVRRKVYWKFKKDQ